MTRLRAYVALTKPRIIELLLITTLPAMFLAARGLPRPWLVAATLIGGTLSAGGANTLNCYLDRDIDARMRRTRRRPLVTAQVSPPEVLALGLLLVAASTCWLGLTVNWLSAALALFACAFYLVGYTMLLKRRSPQNVVWCGIAGCMPVLIGWTAVTGRLAVAPFALFGVVFFWTPPHTWALAMRYKDDYKAAGVPMLPAVATERQVTKQILIYTWLTVAATLALALATGWLYTAVAAVAGVWFLAMAHQLYAGVRRGEPVKPLRLFLQSNNYLAVVFCALALDSALALPTLLRV
jgi:heme o synthase